MVRSIREIPIQTRPRFFPVPSWWWALMTGAE